MRHDGRNTLKTSHGNPPWIFSAPLTANRGPVEARAHGRATLCASGFPCESDVRELLGIAIDPYGIRPRAPRWVGLSPVPIRPTRYFLFRGLASRLYTWAERLPWVSTSCTPDLRPRLPSSTSRS